MIIRESAATESRCRHVSNHLEHAQYRCKTRVGNLNSLHDQIKQMVIVQRQQFLELFKLNSIQPGQMPLVKPLQNQIQFEQPSPAVPAYTVEFGHGLLSRA